MVKSLFLPFCKFWTVFFGHNSFSYQYFDKRMFACIISDLKADCLIGMLHVKIWNFFFWHSYAGAVLFFKVRRRSLYIRRTFLSRPDPWTLLPTRTSPPRTYHRYAAGLQKPLNAGVYNSSLKRYLQIILEILANNLDKICRQFTYACLQIHHMTKCKCNYHI